MSHRIYSLRFMFYCRNKENIKGYAKGAIRDEEQWKRRCSFGRCD